MSLLKGVFSVVVTMMAIAAFWSTIKSNFDKDIGSHAANAAYVNTEAQATVVQPNNSNKDGEAKSDLFKEFKN